MSDRDDRWTAVPFRHPLSLLLLAVCLGLGAFLNVQRVAWWTTVGFVDLRTGSLPPLTAEATAPRVLGSYGKILLTAPAWRPLDLTLDVRARSGSPDVDVPIAIDGRPAGVVHASSDWAQRQIVANDGAVSAAGDDRLTLSWDVDPKVASGFELRAVSGRPRMTAIAIALHALPGAAIGGLLFLLWHPRTWRWLTSNHSAQSNAGESRARLALIGIAIFLWFLAWGAVKPMFHVPDEPQHLLRAEAQLQQPWAMKDATFTPDRRFLNPLALWHPLSVWKVVPRVSSPLTIADVDTFTRVTWGQEGGPEATRPYRTAIASYPPLYYWSLFATAEPIAAIARVSPYHAIWIYRTLSGLGAALLWLCVYIVLRRLPDTRPLAPELFAFLLLNPMVGYLGAAITADAFSVPLATLSLLLAWQTASRGTGAGALVAALLAGLLVKPSGLQVAGCIAVATAILAIAGRVSKPNAARVLLAVIMTGVLAYAAFYAWSPPRIFGEPQPATIVAYLTDLPGRLGMLWTSAWGELGWMDSNLTLAWPWYAGILAFMILGALCAIAKPAASASALWFFAASGLVFIAMTFVGEYRYLAHASYFLQGRYFLPALAGLLPALMHRVPPARLACLLLLLVMNLLLMAETVQRCYGDWNTFIHALPFVA